MPPATLMRGKLRPDDIADADERGRQAGRRPRNAAEMRHVADGFLFEVEMLDDGARESEKAFDIFAEDLRAFVVGENFDEPAESQRAKNVARSFAGRGFAGLDDLVTRHAFGPRQRRVHAQRAAQKNDEEHADQPAHQQDQRRFPIVRAQVGPQALAADIDHHERRDGEDGAGHQRFAHRGRGARDVLLQNAAAKRRDAEQRHRDHGRGNGSGDGLPGFHSQIGVGRSENERQEDAERDRLDGHLRRRLFHEELTLTHVTASWDDNKIWATLMHLQQSVVPMFQTEMAAESSFLG